MFGRNDFLGEVLLPLGHEVFERPGLKWYPLQERLESVVTGSDLSSVITYKGDLFVALKFVVTSSGSASEAARAGSAPLPSSARGELHILVKEAHNLMPTRSNGTSDPFVKRLVNGPKFLSLTL